VAADLQADLFAAVQAGPAGRGPARQRAAGAPLVAIFYAPPFVDMHNRMKEALAILGRIPDAHVRPPLTPVQEGERGAVRQALAAAGLRA
jgi:4-hydroxy-tetrahydrodipicolinate synthase